jgi:hypothetical protein
MVMEESVRICSEIPLLYAEVPRMMTQKSKFPQLKKLMEKHPIMLGLTILQNASFTLVSRARTGQYSLPLLRFYQM